MSGSKSIRADTRPGRRPAFAILARAAAIPAACALAAPASAHGFGERYELPLPLPLFLYGTAAVVVFTFLVVGLFVRRPPRAGDDRRVDLLAHPVGRAIAHPAIAFALRLAALVLFVVTVTAGFLGDQNPYRNIAPTLVWIILWVGLAYVSAFVGDIWALVNPWRTAFQGAELLYGRLSGGRELSRSLPWPESLGVWPAVALLLAFSWIELVYPTPAVPARIACFALGYSILTWTGMALFGRETWLRHGELFTLVFGTFARFAPTGARPGPRGQELVLRPFGTGLLDTRDASPSMTAFVLLLLSTVLYDGFLSTPEWSRLDNAAGALLRGPGELQAIAVRSVGLVAFWLLFLAVYVAVCAMMSAAASGQRPTREIADRFVFTLVPIAIGYHLAHYLVFLLIQGQYIVPLASDPFGRGWNLFGTAGYRVDIAVVGARFAWYAAVAAIVVGHVIAVWLAHVKAMQLFEPRRMAMRSQIPLTALMVVYTFVSLSVLAEPIIDRREPAAPAAEVAEIAVPADAVLPEPVSGRLQPVGPDRFARAKLTYRVLGSAFHDGTRMTVADILYAYMFAYRWGVRTDADDAHYDPYVDAATAGIRDRLVGLQAIGSDTVSRSFRIGDVDFLRELFTVDVYATAIPEDPERDAIVAPPWSTLPWHLIVLMEEAVERGWAAFSQAEAEQRGVEWLDLVRSAPMNARLASLVETFEREAYRPETLAALVNPEEARRRWAALRAFYEAHGHFLVTNGPYRLKGWSAESTTLEAFRDLTYPLGVGSYDAYAIPRRGFITGIEQEKNRLKLSGDIETAVKVARDYRIEREPLQAVSQDVLKRAAPKLRYTVTDDAGRVVLAGTEPLGEDLTFLIDLDGRLPAGDYSMAALIAVNENAMNPDIRRFPVLISPDP